MIESGCHIRTSVHRIDCYWESLGDARDFKLFSDIGLWIGKNEKVLDKKREAEVVRLVADQFPQVTLCHSRDDHGRLARWVR